MIRYCPNRNRILALTAFGYSRKEIAFFGGMTAKQVAGHWQGIKRDFGKKDDLQVAHEWLRFSFPQLATMRFQKPFSLRSKLLRILRLPE